MPQVARILCGLWILVFLHGAIWPAPAPADDTAVRPRILREYAEPADAVARLPDAAQSDQATWPDPAAPRTLRTQFQPPNSRDDESTVPPAAGQTLPQRLPPPAKSIPLAPLSSEPRGAEHMGEASALLTGAASLGIVLGLFLLVVWVVRRGLPKNATLLPREAVEVLGRAPLVGKQQVHLVRCGNKILLLCVTPTGVETLTEITDPEEVDRLAGICQQTAPYSATASFQQVFQQLGNNSRGARYARQQNSDEIDFGSLDSLRGQEQHA